MGHLSGQRNDRSSALVIDMIKRNPTSMLRAAEMLPPVPPARIEPDRRSELIRYVEVPLPLDLRCLAWVEHQIVTPRRIVRLTLWCWRLFIMRPWWRAHELIAVIASDNVSTKRYEERQAICMACEHRVSLYDSRWSWRNGEFCHSCECPRWPLARLIWKNTKSRWRCPRRKHPGIYPRYRIAGKCRGARENKERFDG